MLAIDHDVSPRHRGAAAASGPGCFGDAADHRVQRVLYAARAWVSEQEGAATLGGALMLLHADRLAPERREAMVRCFERVLFHAPQDEVPALAASLRGAGLLVDAGLAALAGPAADVRAAVQALDQFRPFPAGWSLSEVPRDAGDPVVRAVQELHVASGLAPLPGWYLRGGEGRAATFALHDAGGRLAGCTTLSLITPPRGEAEGVADGPVQLGLLGAPPLWIAAPGEPPSYTAMPICTCLREDARGKGLSAPLHGAALKAGYERFGIRWFYAVVRADDEVAARMAARCGLSPHLAEGFLRAELPPA